MDVFKGDAIHVGARLAEQGNTLLRQEVQGIFSPSDKNRPASLLDVPAGGDTMKGKERKDEETGG
jgi:hypothetical protein